MKNMTESLLGMPNTDIAPHNGRFDRDAFGFQEILSRAKTYAHETMQDQRNQIINSNVKGNGPGAAEMRALVGNAMGFYQTGDETLLYKWHHNIKNKLGWNIAAECKKCATGDFQGTAFARDLASLNVTFKDGTKLSGDFATARDQIASFVTGGTVAKYADLDATGKGKANVVMSLLSQETSRAVYDSHSIALDPKNGRSTYSTTFGPDAGKQEFLLSFDEDGVLNVAVSTERHIQSISGDIPQQGPDGQTTYTAKTVATGPGATIGADVAFSVKADEFERLANLDYSKFDDTNANDGTNIDKFKNPVASVGGGFGFSTDNKRPYVTFSGATFSSHFD